MRKRLAGGLALATVGLLALGACSSSKSTSSTPGAAATGGTSNGVTTLPGSIGGIPAGSTAAKVSGGTIRYALLGGATPNWILPMPTGATNSVYNVLTFEMEMWRPLYFVTNGASPQVDTALSPANVPAWSNNGTTMTITLKGWKWNNGQPITSKDLEFTFDMIKAATVISPANWAAYTPGQFPDIIKDMKTPDANTLVVDMTKAVNPTWLEEDIFGNNTMIMPSFAWAKTSATGSIEPESAWGVKNGNNAVAKQIMTYLLAQSKSVSTYQTNPLWQVVYGPYKLSQYNPTNGQFVMVPNTAYSGPHAAVMENFEGVAFTSEDAEWNAVKSGQVDVAYVPGADLPQIGSVKGLGYNYFGLPDFGWNALFYNFADKTNSFGSIIGQLYMRQALQHLVDQQGIIKGAWHGAADPAYGPVPGYPQNPYLSSDATSDPYPFSISAAQDLLKSHGWTVQGGVQTCTSPGSGSTQCGAGVPAGAKLNFQIIYNSTVNAITQQVEDLASKGRQVGINISLKASNFNTMINDDNDAAAPANDNKWQMEDFGGESNSTYPTQNGVLNTGGGGQIGNYSDPQADSLIHASIYSTDPLAVKNEESYFIKNLPVMWQPLQDYTWVWKTNVQTSDPKAMEILTQYNVSPEFWYLTK